MNRRGFLSTLAKAAAGFTILPAATTYSRVWKVERAPLIYAWSNEQLLAYNALPYQIAYRANMNGLMEQLRACGKVFEPAAPLDIDKLLPTLYAIKRERDRNPMREFFDTIFFNAPIPYELKTQLS